ncbi:hypothetical protein [Thermotomaculum hydrothermale]|uniref:hypothetical protein n=1 Tax=Thermotomaculum hydrothermale TaxID=981385 RepID=UPI00191556A5|nr:hypothetical protein [Thermotomaculum hydrothermale]
MTPVIYYLVLTVLIILLAILNYFFSKDNDSPFRMPSKSWAIIFILIVIVGFNSFQSGRLLHFVIFLLITLIVAFFTSYLGYKSKGDV